jgi:hypothetical protein
VVCAPGGLTPPAGGRLVRRPPPPAPRSPGPPSRDASTSAISAAKLGQRRARFCGAASHGARRLSEPGPTTHAPTTLTWQRTCRGRHAFPRGRASLRAPIPSLRSSGGPSPSCQGTAGWFAHFGRHVKHRPPFVAAGAGSGVRLDTGDRHVAGSGQANVTSAVLVASGGKGLSPSVPGGQRCPSVSPRTAGRAAAPALPAARRRAR